MSLGQLAATLSTGTITVTVGRATMAPEALFGFAERCNPRRSFLFVSKVLGRHIPVSPATMRASYVALAEQLPADAPGPVLVMGMAETAIGLGAGVHQEYAARRGGADAVYLTTTRHRLGTPLLTEFYEEHSHAAHHLVHRPLDPAIAALVLGARTLVMVDDEASTGRTFLNLYRALRAAGLDAIEKVYLVTLTDWSAGSAERAIGAGAASVSLLSGSYDWRPAPGASVPVMPVARIIERPPVAPRADRNWGRLGVLDHADADPGDITAAPGERILVVGTSEHVWRPFLLAERLERQGATVHYSSVTRSPIANGHAVSGGIAFTDNYGLGIANFLYNVDRSSYDRVLLCTETAADTVDPALLRHLDPQIIADTQACPS